MLVGFVEYPVSSQAGYPVSGQIIGRISGQIIIQYNPTLQFIKCIQCVQQPGEHAAADGHHHVRGGQPRKGPTDFSMYFKPKG